MGLLVSMNIENLVGSAQEPKSRWFFLEKELHSDGGEPVITVSVAFPIWWCRSGVILDGNRSDMKWARLPVNLVQLIYFFKGGVLLESYPWTDVRRRTVSWLLLRGRRNSGFNFIGEAVINAELLMDMFWYRRGGLTLLQKV